MRDAEARDVRSARSPPSSPGPAAAAAATATAVGVVSHDACEAKLELFKTAAARQLADARSEHARERTTWQDQLQATQVAKDAADQARLTLQQQHDAAQAAFEAERVAFRAKGAVQTAIAAADRQQALQCMHAGHTALLGTMRQLQQAQPSAVAALLQQMCDTQGALVQPLEELSVNQSTVDNWLEQYDTVTAHVALLADEHGGQHAIPRGFVRSHQRAALCRSATTGRRQHVDAADPRRAASHHPTAVRQSLRTSNMYARMQRRLARIGGDATTRISLACAPATATSPSRCGQCCTRWRCRMRRCESVAAPLPTSYTSSPLARATHHSVRTR